MKVATWNIVEAEERLLIPMPSGYIINTPSINPLHIRTSEPSAQRKAQRKENVYMRDLCHVPFRGLIRAGRYNRCWGQSLFAKLKFLASISSSLIKSPKFSLSAIQGVLSTVLLTYHAASHCEGRSFVMVTIFVLAKSMQNPLWLSLCLCRKQSVLSHAPGLRHLSPSNIPHGRIVR